MFAPFKCRVVEPISLKNLHIIILTLSVHMEVQILMDLQHSCHFFESLVANIFKKKDIVVIKYR